MNFDDDPLVIAQRWMDYVEKKSSFKGLTLSCRDFTLVCEALLARSKPAPEARATCATCKHRSDDFIDVYRSDADGNELPVTYYACKKVEHGNAEPGEKSYQPGKKALVIDGSGYHARLVVEPDYGCALHESREPQNGSPE